jgi:hypothetical protein
MRMMRTDRLRSVWECELDRLELDVVRVERLLGRLDTVPVEPWQPAEVSGPMPADLSQRATVLLERQERATTALRSALGEVHRQLAYADRVSDAVGPAGSRPVYVDIDA